MEKFKTKLQIHQDFRTAAIKNILTALKTLYDKDTATRLIYLFYYCYYSIIR